MVSADGRNDHPLSRRKSMDRLIEGIHHVAIRCDGVEMLEKDAALQVELNR